MESTRLAERERYRVSWTRQSAVKRVEVVDATTGRRGVGTDWASWDAAYNQALVRLIRQPI